MHTGAFPESTPGPHGETGEGIPRETISYAGAAILFLLPRLRAHIPRYIQQDPHFAQLQQQRGAAVAEKRQRSTRDRDDTGHNEQVHQRLDGA